MLLLTHKKQMYFNSAHNLWLKAELRLTLLSYHTSLYPNSWNGLNPSQEGETNIVRFKPYSVKPKPKVEFPLYQWRVGSFMAAGNGVLFTHTMAYCFIGNTYLVFSPSLWMCKYMFTIVPS